MGCFFLCRTDKLRKPPVLKNVEDGRWEMGEGAQYGSETHDWRMLKKRALGFVQTIETVVVRK